MDKRNWYFRQVVSEDNLDEAFDRVEEHHEQALVDIGATHQPTDAKLGGIMHGLKLTIDGVNVGISAGVAYDSLGRKLQIDSDITVEVTSTGTSSVGVGGPLDGGVPTAPGVGFFRYLSLFIEFQQILSDPAKDGTDTTVYTAILDSFQIVGTQGVPGNPSGTLAPLGTTRVLLGDVVIDENSLPVSIYDLRRQSYIHAVDDETTATTRDLHDDFPVRGLDVDDGGAREAIITLLGFYNDHVRRDGDATDKHSADEVDMPLIPGGEHPLNSGDLTGQIGEIIDYLNSMYDTEIFADAKVSGASNLASGRVSDQLQELLDYIETAANTVAALTDSDIASAAIADGSVSLPGTSTRDQLLAIAAYLSTDAYVSGIVSLTAGTAESNIQELADAIDTLNTDVGNAIAAVDLADVVAVDGDAGGLDITNVGALTVDSLSFLDTITHNQVAYGTVSPLDITGVSVVEFTGTGLNLFGLQDTNGNTGRVVYLINKASESIRINNGAGVNSFSTPNSSTFALRPGSTVACVYGPDSLWQLVEQHNYKSAAVITTTGSNQVIAVTNPVTVVRLDPSATSSYNKIDIGDVDYYGNNGRVLTITNESVYMVTLVNGPTAGLGFITDNSNPVYLPPGSSVTAHFEYNISEVANSQRWRIHQYAAPSYDTHALVDNTTRTLALSGYPEFIRVSTTTAGQYLEFMTGGIDGQTVTLIGGTNGFLLQNNFGSNGFPISSDQLYVPVSESVTARFNANDSEWAIVGTSSNTYIKDVHSITSTGTDGNITLAAGELSLNFNSADPLYLTSMSGGYDGREIAIVCSSADEGILIEHNSGPGGAFGSMSCPGGVDMVLPAGGAVKAVYSSSSGYWHVVGCTGDLGGIASWDIDVDLSTEIIVPLGTKVIKVDFGSGATVPAEVSSIRLGVSAAVPLPDGYTITLIDDGGIASDIVNTGTTTTGKYKFAVNYSVTDAVKLVKIGSNWRVCQ